MRIRWTANRIAALTYDGALVVYCHDHHACSGKFRRRILAGATMLILVLEDDTDCAACVVMALRRLGHTAVHARSVKGAIELINQEPSIAAALLDVDLGGETGANVAVLLTERGIPYLVASSYAGDEIPAVMRGGPHLRKPYLLKDLESALELCRACLDGR